ncbi:MAG: DNA repair protein RecO, partial [Verrucomicrobiota bacterium]|nr:DNA repair protein RecO [Verrucomicrobiota bacterium]
MEGTAAILLRRTRLSETSWIVTWLTRDCGKIKTVAKGARRPKSAFAGKLDLFFEAEIQFVRSKKSDLHILKELALSETFEGLRLSFPRLQLGSYFVALIELVTEPEHAAPELFELLVRALKYLSNGAPTKRALLHFESELSRLLGISGEERVSAPVAIGR